MNDKQAEHVAQIFRQQSLGIKLSAWERSFLQRILDRMDAAERAGIISAIIQIMLKEN
jgi:hypothetical protein